MSFHFTQCGHRSGDWKKCSSEVGIDQESQRYRGSGIALMDSAAVVDFGAGGVDSSMASMMKLTRCPGGTQLRWSGGRSIGVSRSIVANLAILICLAAIKPSSRLSPAGCQQVFSFEAALKFLVSHLASCKVIPIGWVALKAFPRFNKRHT